MHYLSTIFPMLRHWCFNNRYNTVNELRYAFFLDYLTIKYYNAEVVCQHGTYFQPILLSESINYKAKRIVHPNFGNFYAFLTNVNPAYFKAN